MILGRIAKADSCDEERLELKPSEMFKPHICVTGNIPDVADTKSICDVMLHLQTLNLNASMLL